MFLQKNKFKITLAFLVLLFAAYFYFDKTGAYDHKISGGIIKAKVILPARTEMRGKILQTIPTKYVFMVQNDTITEKFEVNEEIYNSYREGEEFSVRK